MNEITTIGYEGTTVERLVGTLKAAGVELVVDVRAVANSRRPGFAKTKLSENLAASGIGYLHLRGLGTPAAGRAAARADNHHELDRVYREHLTSGAAQTDLAVLADIVRAGCRVSLLCLEADPARCHRSMVADALAVRLPLRVEHLYPNRDTDPDG